MLKCVSTASWSGKYLLTSLQNAFLRAHILISNGILIKNVGPRYNKTLNGVELGFGTEMQKRHLNVCDFNSKVCLCSPLVSKNTFNT